MKKITFLFFLVPFFASCVNESGYKRAEDAEDAGREFIRASLDGNYNKALFYLLKDSTDTNVMLLDKWRKDYNRSKEEDKVKFKEASIIAIRIQPVNDSTVNYVYTNSFEPTDTTTIKIVRVNQEWRIDLKDIH